MLDLGCILVVDDDDDLRVLLATALRGLGYEIHEAADVSRAIAVLKTVPIDLVITDIQMPGASGLDLLGTITAARIGVDVLVMSAQKTIAKAVEAMRLGAKNYLEKPVDLEALKNEVRAIFRARAEAPTVPPPATPAPAPGGGRTIGRFEVIEAIGSGGMGTVYRCDDPVLRRRVAVKVLHLTQLEPKLLREVTERFSREAQSAAGLNHPHIATVYDFGTESSGHLYIAMEHVEGPSLATLLSEGKKLELARALRIAEQLASALCHAHERGIVHRDVKPANVLLAKGETVKLVDFGIARLGGSDLTQRGLVLGSPGYLSPEAAAGMDVDYRADQFSVGSVLFEMLTGTKPFWADDVMSSLRFVIAKTLPALATFGIKNKRLQNFLNRVHQKDRELRYTDESEMMRDLAELTRA